MIKILILNNIFKEDGFLYYVNIIVYPLFIMLLPLKISKSAIIFLGFLIGMGVDLFSDTIGIHAAASVFLGYVRPTVLSFMEPRVGYNVNKSPTIANFGLGWFVSYASVLLLLHLFFYFSVEAFSFVYFIQIFLKTIFSYFISIIFILMYCAIFNAKD